MRGHDRGEAMLALGLGCHCGGDGERDGEERKEGEEEKGMDGRTDGWMDREKRSSQKRRRLERENEMRRDG